MPLLQLLRHPSSVIRHPFYQPPTINYQLQRFSWYIFLIYFAGPTMQFMRRIPVHNKDKKGRLYFIRGVLACLCLSLSSAVAAQQHPVPLNGERPPETKIEKLSNKLNALLLDEDTTQNKMGFVPMAGYETLYGFYIGAGYELKKTNTHPPPASTSQVLGVRYSITENSISLLYNAMIAHIIGETDLHGSIGFDMIRDVNYFGTGNETILHSRRWFYYDLLTRDIYGRLGLGRLIDSVHDIRLSLVYDRVRVVRRLDQFISNPNEHTDPTDFHWKSFAGIEGSYEWTRVDDPAFVMRGVHVLADVMWLKNLTQANHMLANYQLSGGAYIPLLDQLSFIVKAGGAALTGQPEFYQLNNIGGIYNLRGFRRYRFYGHTAFFNQNEVRWAQTLHTEVRDLKWGLLAFFDNGRVWEPQERSRLWHTGYGGGFMVEPQKNVSIVVTYGISKEDQVVNLHVGKYF
jgi:Haemolysin secretion/activation protein ShlB/FhaC/HecB